MAEVRHHVVNRPNYVGLYRSNPAFEESILQVKQLQDFAHEHRADIELIDISALASRPGTKLMEHLIDKNPAAVVLWRLDCLPHYFDLQGTLSFFGALSRQGISLVSIRDAIDSFESGSEFLSRFDLAWTSLKKSRKTENARASSLKAKARNHMVGRKRLRNDQEIRVLRSKGLSIRSIAERIGLSTTAVQRALADREEPNPALNSDLSPES